MILGFQLLALIMVKRLAFVLFAIELPILLWLTIAWSRLHGFFGGQLQYNFLNDLEKKWSASARTSFTSMFGPEDLNLTTYGLDVLASKEFPFYKWASVSPYVGISTYLSNSHEKTDKVNLHDEHVAGGQAMVGAVLKLSAARIGVEYNFARLSTLSFKIGDAF